MLKLCNKILLFYTSNTIVKVNARQIPGIKVITQIAMRYSRRHHNFARALDLRGLLTALRLMERGLSPEAALEMGIINKAFDPFERQLTADVVWARVPRTAKADEFFGD